MADYLQIKFRDLSTDQQDILVALLTEAGFEGFEESTGILSAYIPLQQFDEKAFEELIAAQQVAAEREVVREKNWNEEWERNFEPVIIGDFCAVRASFHQPIGGVGHELVITPKMSFGTGHHATTCIMIEFIKEIPLSGKRVLDFGTGTGILAILSEKCGAASITAIDHDEYSMENASENIAINQCSKITLQQADSLHGLDRFDVILANINRHVILANMAEMRQHLVRGGVLILSGLLPDDEAVIVAKATEHDLRIQQQKTYNNWIGLMLE